jgi:hypothetical protein
MYEESKSEKKRGCGGEKAEIAFNSFEKKRINQKLKKFVEDKQKKKAVAAEEIVES